MSDSDVPSPESPQVQHRHGICLSPGWPGQGAGAASHIFSKGHASSPPAPGPDCRDRWLLSSPFPSPARNRVTWRTRPRPQARAWVGRVQQRREESRLGKAGEVRVGGVNGCHVMSSPAGCAPHSPGPLLRSFLPCCHSVPLYSTDGILLVSFKPAAPA